MTHLIHKSIQESLFTLLSGDSGLNAIVTGIFDSAPEQQPYPYVIIDTLTSRDWSTRTSLGFNTSIPILVYGQEGKSQLLDITDKIYEIIVEGNITLLSHQLVAMRFETHEVQQESDGITCRGMIRFRAYSEFVPV